jgi:hypothetical protein
MTWSKYVSKYRIKIGIIVIVIVYHNDHNMNLTCKYQSLMKQIEHNRVKVIFLPGLSFERTALPTGINK